MLSRGLISGSGISGPGDIRNRLPRFSEANLAANRSLVASLAAIAAELGHTPGQVAIAWALAKQPGLIAVLGSRTRKQLDEALGAAQLRLSEADLARLEAALPATAVAGTRYEELQMRHLDSERPS